MKTITLDIETIADWGEDTFAPITLHEPVAICWLLADHVTNRFKFMEGQPEEYVQDRNRADRLYSWNGRGFDALVINLAMLARGKPDTSWESKRHRFPNYKTGLFHYDLKDQIADYQNVKGMTLDLVCKKLGLPGKDKCDGGDVAKLYEAGEVDKIKAYCMADVADTFQIALRFMHWQTGLDVIKRTAWAFTAWANDNGAIYGRYNDYSDHLIELGWNA